MTDTLCGGVAPEFEFDFELVFPAALFGDRVIRPALKEAGIERDSRANRMPVFCNRAARLAFAEANDRVKEAMWNAGWGIRAGRDLDDDENEAARAARLAIRIREKIAAEREGRISSRVKRLGILQIHFFEAERLKGRSVDPGALKACLEHEAGAAHPGIRPLGMWEAQALIHSADMLRGRRS